MHNNSLAADKLITDDGTKDKRRKAIIEIFVRAQRPLSDWEVLQRFKPGSDNLNLVRPRISEMYGGPNPVLEEGPPARSHCKNCNVRTSQLVSIKRQMKLTL